MKIKEPFAPRAVRLLPYIIKPIERLAGRLKMINLMPIHSCHSYLSSFLVLTCTHWGPVLWKPSIVKQSYQYQISRIPKKLIQWINLTDMLGLKNRYAMRTCVCYSKIIVGYVVVLHCTECWLRWFCMVSSLFRSFKNQWDYWKKKIKNLKDKVTGS